MIRPLLKDEEFLDDVHSCKQAHDGRLRLWWLGQSGFLLQWEGHHLLLDPYLSDSLTRKYANTDKPHVRMTERVVNPLLLDFIDLVTTSHNHTDHLDAETLGPLLLSNPGLQIAAPAVNAKAISEKLGLAHPPLLLLQEGGTITRDPFTITAVPAAHEELGPEYLGYVIQCGEWKVYHSGDTVLYPGIADRLRPFALDLALLPINGKSPERRVAGNLSCREAAELGKAASARCIIPCHYEMFEFNTADPKLFAAAADELGQPYRVLRCGERWESNAPDFDAGL